MRILGLSSIGHWGITVRAVMLTIIICSSGVSYNQQLLDLTLQEDTGRVSNKPTNSLQFSSRKLSFRKQSRYIALR